MSNLANGLAAGKGASISERSDVAVTHVAARRGARAALDDAARAAFGTALPSAPRVIEAGEVTVVWAGPDQWLFIQKAQAGADPSVKLAAAFQELASVVDVSDSRTFFRVDASRPSQAIVRSMGIDFDHDAFKPGDVAITHVSHLGVIVWRLPDGSGYEFACARTYARDFREWLGKV